MIARAKRNHEGSFFVVDAVVLVIDYKNKRNTNPPRYQEDKSLAIDSDGLLEEGSRSNKFLTSFFGQFVAGVTNDIKRKISTE